MISAQIKYVLVLLLLRLMQVVDAAEVPQQTTIRALGQQSALEASHFYYQDLLQQVLLQTEADFGPVTVTELPPPPHGNMAYLLKHGSFIDLHRFGTSVQLEQDLLPIRIPLLGGGLGWRGFLIRQADQPAFRQIRSLAELKLLTACQGMHWPDTLILEHAGLKILRVDGYQNMLDMLRKKRCDYFPRSIFEGPNEVRQWQSQYPDILFETAVLIKYKFPMYFFVNKNNPELARRLQQGLQKMIDSGSFRQFMQQHPVSRHVFPLTQYQQSLIFELPNPFLPLATPIHMAEYWLELPAAIQTNEP